MGVKKKVNDALGYLIEEITKCNRLDPEPMKTLKNAEKDLNEIFSSEKQPLRIFHRDWKLFPKIRRKVNLEKWWSNKRVYLYNGSIYTVEGEYTDEEAELLVMNLYDSERRKFERLKNKFSNQEMGKHEKIRVPESVRIEVWRRDQGVCAQCGSREKLEYDHIIPVSNRSLSEKHC